MATEDKKIVKNSVSIPVTGSQPTTADGRPLRILHVLDHSLPLHSGYAFRTLAILTGQRALGWETFQLTSPKQGRAQDLQEQVGEWIFKRTPPARGWLSGAPIAKHVRLIQALRARLRQVVHDVRPHILHAHSPVLNAFPALAVGREMGLPVVYEIRAFWEDAAADHGTAGEWSLRYRLTRMLETRAAHRADAVTVICEGLRADLAGRGISAEKITVIPNAVDLSRFAVQTRPDSELTGKYALQGGFTLGFAGSFYGYEGLDVLLRAMPQIVRAFPRARLLLVGGGPQEPALKALAVDLGLDRVVHFAGEVPHGDIARYYSVMDVMVYPRLSRRLTELVTPLKPLEAMALDKPVVASDVGGHRELISDGNNGYLFPAGSVEALVRCLIGVLKNGPASWAPVVLAGRKYVERERNWPASVARYRAVYARVLDKQS
ncbi:MAG: glycosyltransferase, exosortase A system-associated [Gammaproteobacteria bacterium]|nr:glycosyltransferase, exosortase A system-associated [Gammaproteobacteria bacterium]